VLLGIDRDLSPDELSTLRQEIVRGGLSVKSLDIGTGPWENTLRLRFVRPSVKGYGQVQLILPIAMGLSLLGLSGILGWQLGQVVSQIGKYIIPITLIAATTFLVYAAMKEGKWAGKR